MQNAASRGYTVEVSTPDGWLFWVDQSTGEPLVFETYEKAMRLAEEAFGEYVDISASANWH